MKVSQKRCLGTSIENFTGSSPSEQIPHWPSRYEEKAITKMMFIDESLIFH